MLIDNYYNRARELQAWALNMVQHVHDYHSAQFDIRFFIGEIFYCGERAYIDGNLDRLAFKAMEDGNETDLSDNVFWAAFDAFLNSYEYAVAYNYDRRNLDEAVETVSLGEDDVLDVQAAQRLNADQRGKKLKMRFKFFKTKNDALIWAMQASNPEVVARDGATLGPTFYWWRPM